MDIVEKNLKQKQLKYLNIAKAIAIIMMVCGHCDNIGIIEHFVSLFHMSIFMFISGFLFKDRHFENFKQLVQYLKRRIFKLYFFYLKFEVLFFTLTNVFINIGFYSLDSNLNITPFSNLKEYIFGLLKIAVGFGREPFCGAFWYIISLIIVTIGFSTSRYIRDKYKLKYIDIVYVFLATSVGWIMAYTTSIPRLSPALTLTVIYYFGVIAYKYSSTIKFNNLFVAIVSIILLIILNNFVTIGLNSNTITNPLAYLVCSISGIYSTIYISKIIEKYNKICNIFDYIGKNTMSIMAWHFLSFKIVMCMQLLLGVINIEELSNLTGANNNNIWYIAYVLVGTFVPILLNLVINKLKVILRKLIK